MSNIYDCQRSYSWVRRYIIFTFKRFYGEYIVTGRENIPQEGPVIFASNHLNALMDALAVISVTPQKLPIIYLGRADMFKNVRARKILHFCKLLPAFRQHEGYINLEKNLEIFDLCSDVLDHNKAIGIMPEVRQGFSRKIRQLGKGTFRIAFSAQQKYMTQPGVKIVPIGIDFEDFENYGKYIILNIGKPIEVSEYMTEYMENPVKATNRIRERLRQDLIKLTFNLDTVKNYEYFETATAVANMAVTKKMNLQNKTLPRFLARQKIAEWLIKMEKKSQPMTDQLEIYCKEYKENLHELNLQSWVFDEKTYKTKHLFVTILVLIITLPVYIIGFLLNMLPFFSPDIILKALKVDLRGGISSLRFGLGMFTFPIFYFIQGVFIYKMLNGYFWNLIIIIPLQYFFGKLTFQWYKTYKKLVGKLRHRKLEYTKSETFERTQILHEQIIGMVKAS